MLRISLIGISNPKHGAVLSSSCAVGFVLSLWLRGLDPFRIGGLRQVLPSSQGVSAGPGQSDGTSFVLQTQLLRELGMFDKRNLKLWIPLLFQQSSLTRFLTWLSDPHSV